MKWFALFKPGTGTIAGAAVLAWSLTRKKVRNRLAFGSYEIAGQVMSFCTVILLTACGRWLGYLALLWAFSTIASYLNWEEAIGVVLAIAIKYLVALGLALVNMRTLWRFSGMAGLLHPWRALRDYLERETVKELESRLSRSLLEKIAFYATFHQVEKEARAIVAGAMPKIGKIMLAFSGAYGILLFAFGLIYEHLQEAILNLQFSGFTDYYSWPIRMLFAG